MYQRPHCLGQTEPERREERGEESGKGKGYVIEIHTVIAIHCASVP